jgi:2-polyprenyl-3-methyl-5-hydroxy-6-metoxy-1,4-benzoquinol methylase
MYLLDLLLSPHLANLISLIILAVFGAWGAYSFFRILKISQNVSLLGSFLFINSSWFGLHFAEGHIVFGTFQLIPWILYWGMRLKERAAYFALSSLFAFFLLDGGIYAAVFSGILLLVGAAVRIFELPSWAQLRDVSWKWIVWCFLIFVLLSSAKWIPVLSTLASRTPEIDRTIIPSWGLLYVFFSPRQHPLSGPKFDAIYRFHEYGCYLGILSVILIGSRLRFASFRAKNLRWMIFGLVWLWIATGWGGDFNLYTLIQKTPILHNAHVQSRYFILMYVCFLVLLCRALDDLSTSKTSTKLIFGFLILEFFCVKNYPLWMVYRYSPRDPISAFITSDGKDFKTFRSIGKPDIYLRINSSSVHCYEPAAKDTSVKASEDQDYRGEIYPINGDVQLTLEQYQPGLIQLSYETVRPATVELNTNYLNGWAVVRGGDATAFGTQSGLLGVQLLAGKGIVVLKYAPFYLKYIWTFFVAGVVVFASGLWLLSRKSLNLEAQREIERELEPRRFNYDAIPLGYYDEVVHTGHPVQKFWHRAKFERILDCLPDRSGQSILDIGCFSGTFLSFLKPDQFSKQVGVDILDRQIQYARQHYGTEFREFHHIRDSNDISAIQGKFDCVTLIEVIEHLKPQEIQDLLNAASEKLKPGGKLLFSTPNYFSTWPILEWLVNRISKVSYEEQHITKFNYFNIFHKLRKIYPNIDEKFLIKFKTTTHFVSPFLAWICYGFAEKLSRKVPHQSWKFPFGNLIIVEMTRKSLN